MRVTMPKRLADRSGSSNPNDVSHYSGVLVSFDAEIRQLRHVADPLMPQDDTVFHPELFLASVSRGWKPRVVAVHRAHEVVGIMYTKERVISGVPTGVVYADGSLDSILLANPVHRQQAFRKAVDVLLASSSIRGIRLRILRSTGDLNAIKRLIASNHLDARYTRITKHQEGSHQWRHHAHLSLPGSYEAFLNGLGRATRHNFRYYRRRFEASGHGFVERLTIDELRAAAFAISPKSKLTDRRTHSELAQSLNMVAAARRPVAIGLKHRNGEWLSVIGGWYRSRGAVLLFQSNSDRHFGSDSAVRCAACLLHRDPHPAGAAGDGDLERHRPAIVTLCHVRSSDWRPSGRRDASVAHGPLVYFHRRTPAAQAVCRGREMDRAPCRWHGPSARRLVQRRVARRGWLGFPATGTPAALKSPALTMDTPSGSMCLRNTALICSTVSA